VLATEDHDVKAYWESGGTAPRIHDRGTGWSDQLHALAALPPGKETPPPGTHFIRGWVDPRAGLAVVKR
jgi:hypothetical protein